jgi:putative ABC transport system permease protein
MDRLCHDLTFALRSLVRGGIVTLVAVASLAICIAANTTAFSLVQAVEFPQLPYPEPARLVFFESRNTQRGLTGLPVSLPDAMDAIVASHAIEDAAITADQSSILYSSDGARRVFGKRVTPAFFDVLRIPAALGRTLGRADSDGVIVLSDDLWRTQFAADQGIVGRTIRLDGGVVTVAGVMPPRFSPDDDFWTPLTGPLSRYERSDRQFSVFAGLRGGASAADATRELRQISARLATDFPASNKDWVMEAVPLAHLHGRDSRATFLLLQAAVACVLLIACANVANILLARGTDRRVEMAVRCSLGATRGRLVSALMTEAFALSAVGGGLGVLLSMWGIRIARSLGGFPAILEPHLNAVVLSFTIALSMLTGVICGALPAWRASAVDPEPVLREGGRGATRSSGRMQSALVVIQIAGALVLSISGVLMVRTLANRTRVDLGFDPRNSVSGQLTLPADRYQTPAIARTTVHQILDRAGANPDLVAAGATTWALPTAPGGVRPITVPGEGDRRLSPTVRRGFAAITPAYFAAAGIAVVSGRSFTDADRDGSEPVAIVNQVLARALWPDGNAIGERLRLGAVGEQAPVVTIVGVVATVRRSPMHDVPIARVYVPYAQYPNGSVTIVARTHGNASAGMRAIASATHQVDPDLLLDGVRTQEADVAQFVAPVRMMTLLLTAFAVTGVLLAACGVFASMSYAVAQRRNEMAIRSALGAHAQAIVRMVVVEALGILAFGLTLGILLTFWTTRFLASSLFGVSGLDPLTYTSVVVTLMVVALAACYAPARRAGATDPMVVLRA